MSVIIALKDKDRVVVGTDIRMSDDYNYSDSYKTKPKAIHINKEKTVIIGSVGNLGVLDVFNKVLNDVVKDWDKVDKSYIIRYIIPTFMKECEFYDCLEKDNRSVDGTILLAIKDRAYVIGHSYIVFELEDYFTIGCGDETARGSLYTSKDFGWSPERRIRMAIEASSSVSQFVSAISYVGDTKGKMFTPGTYKQMKNLQ